MPKVASTTGVGRTLLARSVRPLQDAAAPVAPPGLEGSTPWHEFYMVARSLGAKKVLLQVCL